MRYLLCGQRDQTLRERLAGIGSLASVPQPGGDGPQALFLALEDPSVIPDEVACCDDYQACVERLPTVDEWRQSLPVVPDFAHYEFSFQIFDGARFRATSFEQKGGLYEVWTLPATENAQPRRERTLYYDERSSCWRRGDWYGLRFLAHLDRGWEGQAKFLDTGESRLVLPAAARPPETYERALVIASGRLPALHRTDSGDELLVYQGVPRSVADAVAGKLMLRLTGTDV